MYKRQIKYSVITRLRFTDCLIISSCLLYLNTVIQDDDFKKPANALMFIVVDEETEGVLLFYCLIYVTLLRVNKSMGKISLIVVIIM